jgi:hypothetical protein
LTIILAYWPALSIVLIPMLLGVFFFVPGWAGMTVEIVFSISWAILIFSVLQKHKKLYREKSTSKIKMVGNILLEIIRILMAMLLAGLLGRYSAQITTQHISNDVLRFAAGITTGLVVGIGVGILMQYAWRRLIKT